MARHRRLVRVHVDGYVRVSHVANRKGPRFVSPAVQRDAIVNWTARQGFELDEIFEELDESGARPDRPLLEEAIRRIELGTSSALVVWRVDRFGRSLIDGLRHIERIRAAGGGFYSVHDGLDISTDAGRLVLRILLSVAEYQLDGIRAGWELSRGRAVQRGAYVGTTVPVGYRKTRAGRLRPDPRTGPVMTEVFRRRAEGASLLTLCRYLESEGVPTGLGNPGWSTATLSNVLKLRVYLGEISCDPYWRANAHPPLADAATWERVQLPRRLSQQIASYEPALLRGLVRCAGCRHIMRPAIARASPRRERIYLCRRYHAGGTCPAPAQIVATRLEPFVIAAMFRLLARRRRPPMVELREHEANAATALDALVRYRDNDQLAPVLGRERYLEGLATRSARLRDANLRLAEARTRAATHELPSITEVRDAFPSMELEEQRDLIGRVIDTVFVSKGHLHVEARVTVCPAGTQPRDLPRPGHRAMPPVPIWPRRGWLNPIAGGL